MKLQSNLIIIILIILLIISVLLTKYYLKIDELVFSFYSEKLAIDKVEELLVNRRKWNWLSYILAPLIILLRSTLVALCLSVGLFFYDIENKIKLQQLFKVSLRGEFVLIFVGYVKFFYFYFIKTKFTLEELHKFYPLSYTNFLDFNKIAPWLLYPLQTINLFELGYFFVLVYGLNKLLKNRYTKSFEIVAVSYGSGLVIWLGLVMFLTLNLS